SVQPIVNNQNTFQDFLLLGIPSNHYIAGVKINLLTEFVTAFNQDVLILIGTQSAMSSVSNAGSHPNNLLFSATLPTGLFVAETGNTVGPGNFRLLPNTQYW